MRDSETIVVALFGDKSRVGERLRDADLEDKQLKRRDQSCSRRGWTSAADFSAHVATTRAGIKRNVAGLAAVQVKKLREFRFKVPSSQPEISGPAICVIDRVEPGDYAGHAAIGYTEAMNALSDPQKKKTRPLVRLEAARRFGGVESADDFRWQPSLILACYARWFWAVRFLRFFTFRKIGL